jgi:hypothetical protein
MKKPLELLYASLEMCVGACLQILDQHHTIGSRLTKATSPHLSCEALVQEMYLRFQTILRLFASLMLLRREEEM